MPPREVNLVDIAVRNDGLVGARNIRFTWNGEVPRFAEDQKLADIAFLRDGIAFLGPGQSLVTLLTSFGNHPDELFDLDVKMTVEYHGPDGRGFSDDYVLDFGQYRGFSTISDENEKIGDYLKLIADDLRGWVHGSRSPKVITQSLENYRAEQAKKRAELVQPNKPTAALQPDPDRKEATTK
jgi:hypothetical protein